MHNEYRNFRPEAVSNAIGLFASRLETMLDAIGHPDLLAPARDEYRVKAIAACELAIAVDLHLSYGASVTIIAPFSDDEDAIQPGVDAIGERLKLLLGNLPATLTLRDEIAKEANVRMKRVARSDIEGRVTDVRLAAIDVASPDRARAVEVEIEGEACNMLRPFRDVWSVNSVDDLTEPFVEYRRTQKRWLAERRRVNSVGGIGYVDALALKLIEGHSDGRQAALREIARKLETQWHVETEDGGRPLGYGLTWYHGVVRPCASLSDQITLSAEHVFIHGTQINEKAVGQPIDRFVQHPWLEGLTIIDVELVLDLFARIRIEAPVMPFGADGEVIGNDTPVARRAQ
ncbi:MAG TPA: hypothetical protein VFT56_06260 [Sphingomonas sp.]|nr:hypothetical protein [Sphingomonas sp.]